LRRKALRRAPRLAFLKLFRRSRNLASEESKNQGKLVSKEVSKFPLHLTIRIALTNPTERDY
jgi:hypothetical protein